MKFIKHDILELVKNNKLGKGSLVGVNSDIGHLVSYTVHLLKKAKWNQSDIEKVIEESTLGDYFYTIAILSLCLNGSRTEH